MAVKWLREEWFIFSNNYLYRYEQWYEIEGTIDNPKEIWCQARRYGPLDRIKIWLRSHHL